MRAEFALSHYITRFRIGLFGQIALSTERLNTRKGWIDASAKTLTYLDDVTKRVRYYHVTLAGLTLHYSIHTTDKATP